VKQEDNGNIEFTLMIVLVLKNNGLKIKTGRFILVKLAEYPYISMHIAILKTKD